MPATRRTRHRRREQREAGRGECVRASATSNHSSRKLRKNSNDGRRCSSTCTAKQRMSVRHRISSSSRSSRKRRSRRKRRTGEKEARRWSCARRDGVAALLLSHDYEKKCTILHLHKTISLNIIVYFSPSPSRTLSCRFPRLTDDERPSVHTYRGLAMRLYYCHQVEGPQCSRSAHGPRMLCARHR